MSQRRYFDSAKPYEYASSFRPPRTVAVRPPSPAAACQGCRSWRTAHQHACAIQSRVRAQSRERDDLPRVLSCATRLPSRSTTRRAFPALRSYVNFAAAVATASPNTVLRDPAPAVYSSRPSRAYSSREQILKSDSGWHRGDSLSGFFSPWPLPAPNHCRDAVCLARVKWK